MKETRLLKILKNLDALGCTLIANRAKAGEFISTYVWRVRKSWAVRLINRIFDDPHHCRMSFEGQKDALKLVMDEPDCLFCKYSHTDEVRQKFDEESA